MLTKDELIGVIGNKARDLLDECESKQPGDQRIDEITSRLSALTAELFKMSAPVPNPNLPGGQ